jgi:hypothetical protein
VPSVPFRAAREIFTFRSLTHSSAEEIDKKIKDKKIADDQVVADRRAIEFQVPDQ